MSGWNSRIHTYSHHEKLTNLQYTLFDPLEAVIEADRLVVGYYKNIETIKPPSWSTSCLGGLKIALRSRPPGFGDRRRRHAAEH
jgi:hypothetical protein